MTDYVFDTEPLITYLYDEPGAPAVTERLQAIESEEATGAISHTTATEVVYRRIRPSASGLDPEAVHSGDLQAVHHAYVDYRTTTK